jgi:hypothetical protein
MNMNKKDDTKLDQLLNEYGFSGVIEALRDRIIKDAVELQIEGASERDKYRKKILYRTAKIDRNLATKLNKAMQVLESAEDVALKE